MRLYRKVLTNDENILIVMFKQMILVVKLIHDLATLIPTGHCESKKTILSITVFPTAGP